MKFDPISTANEQHLRRLAHVQLDDVSFFLIRRNRWDRLQQHDGVVVDMVKSFLWEGLRQAMHVREDRVWKTWGFSPLLYRQGGCSHFNSQVKTSLSLKRW